jgi:glycosyltransferase involved in cell wall biosynthesis
MAAPAFLNRRLNPYNALLYSALDRAGATIVEATPWALVRSRHDVIHVHWPEYLFSAPTLGRAVAQALLLAAAVAAVRARRTRIVWTVHNVGAHQPWHPRLEARMWRWFVDRVDGYIALTPGGRAAALQRFPTLRQRPGFVIRHGHYRDAYPDEVAPDAARAALGLPAEARVVAFLGAIRPYKSLPDLIAAFRGVPGDDWRLVVAGKPSPAQPLGPIVRPAAGDPRIVLHLAHVPDDRVQLYLRASDLLVFPYREVLNSGSAFLALSFGRPILVPALGAMAELRDTAGAEWVRTYRGELGPGTLVEAMDWARATPRDPSQLLRDLDWDEIARETLGAYEAIRRSAPAGRCKPGRGIARAMPRRGKGSRHRTEHRGGPSAPGRAGGAPGRSPSGRLLRNPDKPGAVRSAAALTELGSPRPDPGPSPAIRRGKPGA